MSNNENEKAETVVDEKVDTKFEADAPVASVTIPLAHANFLFQLLNESIKGGLCDAQSVKAFAEVTELLSFRIQNASEENQ